jgi:deoxyribodipyrimidine photo-lyase
MAFTDSDEARRIALNDCKVVARRFVLYWMQQSQRAECNHALELAVREANRLGQGVVVLFCLMEAYPEANQRHYAFMLEGLRETAQTLEARGIRMIVRRGDPAQVVPRVGREASLIVCDRGYLRHQRQWRETVARGADCHVVQVESDVVVPVEVASTKDETGARTLRPKIRKLLDAFLQPLPSVPVAHASLSLDLESMPVQNTAAMLRTLRVRRDVTTVSDFFTGGSSEARRRLGFFLKNRLDGYALNHNQPQIDGMSQLGPYLHFGQISPLDMALRVREAPVTLEAREAFLEQVIVRRELACNFAHYAPAYDSYDCLPAWARASLAAHTQDPRPHLYAVEQLEAAETHDPYWNAAMREMICTGYMHNYMRMYWGKKILEWSPTPEQGYATTLALNNKYFLDGRDPNSYAGVAWIYGQHDRAWPQRAIYGKVRSMMASGLERKCDILGYVRKVAAGCRREDA